MKVSQLMREEDGMWDVDALAEAVRYLNMMTIIQEVPYKPGARQLEDRLIFTGAQNGNFSIKTHIEQSLNKDKYNMQTCKNKNFGCLFGT